MKKLLIILLIAGMASVTFAETRENLYRKFGPMIVEAIVLVIKDEINLIRAELNLPKRTDAQLMNAIETKLNGLELYNWMSE